MASGDIVGMISRIVPPTTAFPTPDVRVSASSPVEIVSVHDFDDTTAEYLDLECVLTGYGGGGLTINVPWTATSATSGAVVLRAAIRRLNTSDDVDVAHTYDYNSASAVTAPATNGQPTSSTITFTDGADMDSLAAGEPFILRLGRNPSDAGDNMVGDCEVWSGRVTIKET